MAHEDILAKKLPTGEIAIWDAATKEIIVLSAPGPGGTRITNVLRGKTLKSIEQALGNVIVLV